MTPTSARASVAATIRAHGCTLTTPAGAARAIVDTDPASILRTHGGLLSDGESPGDMALLYFPASGAGSGIRSGDRVTLPDGRAAVVKARRDWRFSNVVVGVVALASVNLS